MEASQNLLSRDFRHRSIFDFCNTIGGRAEDICSCRAFLSWTTTDIRYRGRGGKHCGPRFSTRRFQIAGLCAIGVRIALHNFGTGYSSLSYLHRFPFDKIKIDRCFVTDITEPDGSSSIVQAVVNLAAARRMTTRPCSNRNCCARWAAPKCRAICSVRQSGRLTSSSYFSRSTSNRTREPGAKAPACSRQRGSVRNCRLRRRHLRIDGDAAQKVVRRAKRLIVLLVRWNVGLRARLFHALG